MEEKAGNYKEYQNNFILSETLLRKIHSVLEEYAGKIDEDAYVSIYIGRENNSFLETTDLEKILSDENTNGKSIDTLSMEIVMKGSKVEFATEEKKKPVAMIGFTKNKDTKIRFMTSYRLRDWCFLLIDEIDTQVKRAIQNKPTSMIKAKAFDLFVALAILGLLMSGLAFNATETQVNAQELMAGNLEQKINFLVQQTAENNNVRAVWFLPGLAAMMLIFLFALEFKPITKLIRASSMSVFYWGDMVQVYDVYTQKRTRIKWGIVIAFAVSLVASLVGALII